MGFNSKIRFTSILDQAGLCGEMLTRDFVEIEKKKMRISMLSIYETS